MGGLGVTLFIMEKAVSQPYTDLDLRSLRGTRRRLLTEATVYILLALESAVIDLGWPSADGGNDFEDCRSC